MTGSPFHARWFRIAALLALLAAALLAGTPLLIEQLAERWLAEHGEGRVEVQDVDFNPFTAVLRFEGVRIDAGERRPLNIDRAQLDLAWLPLFSHRIDIQELTLSGFRVRVDNTGALRIGSVALPPSAGSNGDGATGAAWYAGIDSLTLEDFTVVYQDTRIRGELNVSRLQLGKLAQWTPDRPAQLQLSARLNGAPVEVDARVAPFAARPSYQGTIRVDKLSLADFEPLARPQLDKLAGMLSLDGKLHVEQDGDHLRLQHDGTLKIDDADVGHPEVAVRSDVIEWKGDSELAMQTDGSELQLHHTGRLGTGRLTAQLKARKLHYAQHGLSLDGDFSLKIPPQGPQIGLTAELGITGLQVSAPEREVDLLDARQLRVEGLTLTAVDTLSARLIRLDGVDLARRTAPSGNEAAAADTFYHADRILFAGLSRAPGLVSIERFDEQGVRARYHRDREGNWYVTRVVDVLRGENKGTATTAEAGQAPAEAENRLRIGRIQVGKGSTLTIFDEAVSPPYQQTLTIDKAVLDKLDSGKPDQPSPLDLEGRIGKHARLGVKGTIKPFQHPPGMDIAATLYAVDLPALSPYTRDTLGVVLDSGSLDVDLKLRSEKRVMEGKAVLKLHQLVLESLDTSKGLQSKVPVPLNVALDTLRDRNNTIELDIPIKGDASSPAFDVSDALSQALAKGVSKGALTYLSMALQPYGALVTVARYAGEAATRVRLKPVEFEPGQTKLDSKDLDYLAKVANILKERPQVAVKLCGVATAADSTFLQQAAAAKKGAKKKDKESAPTAVDDDTLLQLARQRAEGVKDYLVDTLKAPADRLVGCRPRLETDDASAVPRTDLLI
ncbi:MAG TPA: DUF748 domain-containing protein [Gammaproteobacteria bacterium]|nr:DUF748 domain-containing protein [Gammaproteobacteria bacterium]